MNVVRRPHWLPDPEAGESTFVGSVLRQETVGGAIALLAAVVAVVWANVDYASYQDLRHLLLGPLDVEHWAADGALSLFFFVAGLELKRELLVGSLRRPADAVVPVVAAVCGVAVPALVYISVDLASGGDDLVGMGDPERHRHRVRAGRARRGRVRAADAAAGVPADTRGRRRPARDRDHRGLLHRRALLRLARRRAGPAGGVRRAPAAARRQHAWSTSRWWQPPGGACTRAASTPPWPASRSGC